MHQISTQQRKRNKWIPILTICAATFLIIYFFQSNNTEYEVAEVVGVVNESTENNLLDSYSQNVEVKLGNGDIRSTENIIFGGNIEARKLKVADNVVVNTASDLQITDRFRINKLLVGLVIFIAISILFGGIEAMYSLIGLAFSTFVVVEVIIKNILNGANPVLFTIIGGTLIAVFSIYMSHGIRKRTTVAVVSILITMVISVISAEFFVKFTHLFGLGSEDSFYIITDPNNIINLQGILLAGIIIGTLGVLDDVTTAQAAAVDEIQKANPNLTSTELYQRGLSVGKEHISSLINTLFLAYVGAGLPLIIIFFQSDIPTWVLINSELVAEEIARTLVGSTALVLAVPITTVLAVKYLGAQKK